MSSPMARRLVLFAVLSLSLVHAAHAARWVRLSPADTTRPISRAAHCVVLDEPGRRLIAWGGRIPADEVWALALDGPPTWTRHGIEGPSPPPRSIASAIFDSARRRMLVFGGGPGEGLLPTFNDVWALHLDGALRWEQLSPEGTPPKPRELHSAIYDPVRDRMLVFGGFSTSDLIPSGTYENSVWELSLSDPPTWRKYQHSGIPPSPRVGASMVYDPIHDRALIFGGNNPASREAMTYRNDVFALSLDDPPTWTQLLPAGTPPSPRYEHAAVTDATRNRLLVFGGRGYLGLPDADAWALDLGVEPPVWKKAAPDAAFPRFQSGAILDPVTDRWILDGGCVGQGSSYLVTGTIALPLSAPDAWQTLDTGSPAAPSRRAAPALLVDPLRHELIVEGGYDNTTLGAYSLVNGVARSEIMGDQWTWPLDSASPAWTRTATVGAEFIGSCPPVVDPVRGQQVRFSYDPLNVGVRALQGFGPWLSLPVQGAGPPYRVEFSAAYDANRGRVLFAGGYTFPSHGYARIYHRDLWSLSTGDTPAWTSLRADVFGGPAVFPGALFFDHQADQWVAVGDDTDFRAWTWTIQADGNAPWQRLALAGSEYTTVCFDAGARELIAIDLEDGDAFHHVLSDTAGWVPLAVEGDRPPGRSFTSVALDPWKRRVLCFGGQSSDQMGPLGDLWALELDRATPSVSVSGPDVVRIEWGTNLTPGSSVTLERRADDRDWAALLDLLTDAGGAVRYTDTDVHPGLVVDYRLRLGGTLLPGSERHLTVSPRPALALAGARPNPAAGAPSLVFTLSGSFTAKLEVFDVAGRIVVSSSVGELGAGEHNLVLQRGLAPGLYVAVLTQSGRSVSRRFAVTR